jgi:hypothetical protein
VGFRFQYPPPPGSPFPNHSLSLSLSRPQELRVDSRALKKLDVSNCGKLRRLLVAGRQALQLNWDGCAVLPEATVADLEERKGR